MVGLFSALEIYVFLFVIWAWTSIPIAGLAIWGWDISHASKEYRGEYLTTLFQLFRISCDHFWPFSSVSAWLFLFCLTPGKHIGSFHWPRIGLKTHSSLVPSLFFMPLISFNHNKYVYFVSWFLFSSKVPICKSAPLSWHKTRIPTCRAPSVRWYLPSSLGLHPFLAGAANTYNMK